MSQPFRMSSDNYFFVALLNGVHRYQSLHYTASLTIAGEEWPFEVQVRHFPFMIPI
jgi:hypothetical protein